MPAPQRELEDRTVLVWGADEEVAPATASLLARAGTRLLLFGRDEGPLAAIDAELAQAELHRFFAVSQASLALRCCEQEPHAPDALVAFMPPTPDRAAVEQMQRSLDSLTSALSLDPAGGAELGSKRAKVVVVAAWSRLEGPAITALGECREAWRDYVHALQHRLAGAANVNLVVPNSVVDDAEETRLRHDAKQHTSRHPNMGRELCARELVRAARRFQGQPATPFIVGSDVADVVQMLLTRASDSLHAQVLELDGPEPTQQPE